MKRLLAAALTTIAISSGAVAIGASPASATPDPSWAPGTTFLPGFVATGATGCTFRVQSNGMSISNHSGKRLWHEAAATIDDDSPYAVFEPDGDFALFTWIHDGQSYPEPWVIWETSTWEEDAVNIQLQADGNLVIYAAGGIPLWASGTDHGC